MGERLAVLPESRRFELGRDDGEVIRGRVGEELATDQVCAMNTDWANHRCTAHLPVVRLTRGTRSQTRHVLRRLTA